MNKILEILTQELNAILQQLYKLQIQLQDSTNE
jgi:hypothetical protein